MNKELTPLEVSKLLKDFVLEFVENGLDRMFIHGSFDIIETALKNYQELLERPCVLVGRTSGHTKALIDKICKNYKEIKITNLEDEKKLKAFEIIKEKKLSMDLFDGCQSAEQYNKYMFDMPYFQLTQEEYELLKEVFK